MSFRDTWELLERWILWIFYWNLCLVDQYHLCWESLVLFQNLWVVTLILFRKWKWIKIPWYCHQVLPAENLEFSKILMYEKCIFLGFEYRSFLKAIKLTNVLNRNGAMKNQLLFWNSILLFRTLNLHLNLPSRLLECTQNNCC